MSWKYTLGLGLPEVYMMMQGDSGVGGVASTSISLLLIVFLPMLTTSQKLSNLIDGMSDLFSYAKSRFCCNYQTMTNDENKARLRGPVVSCKKKMVRFVVGYIRWLSQAERLVPSIKKNNEFLK